VRPPTIAAFLYLVACSEIPLADRPYDTVVDCRKDDAPPLDATLADAIARTDQDGDGILTEDDLRPGESRFVLRVEGTHTRTGSSVDPGYSTHSQVYGNYADTREGDAWSIQGDVACRPRLGVSVSMMAPVDTASPSRLPLEGINALIAAYNVSGFRSTVQGDVVVQFLEDGRFSGHLEGSGVVDLETLIPVRAPTGQSIWIEAMAFRGLELP